ncbi:MAG TPA: BON domain-containing protein, partial [Verrucomicrobiae bacterium]|nr:BON domain-containing protein [Verrucomicrobiae bacterium]
MKSLQNTIAALGFAFTLFVAGCAGDGTQRSTGEVIDDTAIHTKVKTALVNDPVVSGMAIDVGVARGVVTLNGAVNGDAEKRKAEEIARGVDGVRAVE